MSMGGDGKVEETAEERELARIGLGKLNRYQETYRPIERDFARRMRDPSKDRGDVSREVTSQTRGAFGDARETVEAGLQQGAAPGSGRAADAVTGMVRDEATALGLGQAAGRVAADDQHVRRMQGVVNMGQGKSADALRELGSVAGAAGQQARADASIAQQQRASNLHGLGMAGGAAAAHVMPRGTSNAAGLSDWSENYSFPYR